MHGCAAKRKATKVAFFLMPYLSDNKIIREDDVRTISGKREDHQNKEDTNEKRK